MLSFRGVMIVFYIIMINVLLVFWAFSAEIVIDPGHGGRDPGAIYGKTLEKDIALAISKKVQKYLSNAMLTRHGDFFLTLTERADISNAEEAKIFVSIHVNSSYKPPTVAGPEIWYHTNSYRGKKLAQRLSNALKSFRGVKPTKKLKVLNKTKATAVLIEVGFINNHDDRKNMLNDDWQEDFCYKVANILSGETKSIK